MDELDHGGAGWPQLEVLVALKLDDEVLGHGDGLLILELELHPAVDLHHGTGVGQIVVQLGAGTLGTFSKIEMAAIEPCQRYWHMQKKGQPSLALRNKFQAWMARWPLHSIHLTNWILHRNKTFFCLTTWCGSFSIWSRTCMHVLAK